MNITLKSLNSSLKKFIAVYTIVISIGVGTGLAFLNHTTSFSPKGTIERFNGDKKSIDSDFEVPENYPKPISELLITTHNHILGLAFIFFSIGLIFYFNSIINGRLKLFIMTEPLVSIIISFGSIWLMRFVEEKFVYLAVISASIMYLSFYFMAFISLYELIFKR
ncbi:MAG: hypothetical protein QHH13_09855 [Melioribacter sp.]|uniref:hypothetical protein n=1 Tax=Rosettibacter primus TaxID=3111523 RepID=UPI00247C311C|nr:hypothetical protein [Melioribacter sp.]